MTHNKIIGRFLGTGTILALLVVMATTASFADGDGAVVRSKATRGDAVKITVVHGVRIWRPQYSAEHNLYHGRGSGSWGGGPASDKSDAASIHAPAYVVGGRGMLALPAHVRTHRPLHRGAGHRGGQHHGAGHRYAPAHTQSPKRVGVPYMRGH